MSLPRGPAAIVWLLAGAGAYSIGAAWADDAHTGKLHPWVLIAVFWGVALLSVLIHYVLLYLPQAATWSRRWWHQQAEQRARLRARARIAVAVAMGALTRSARQLRQQHALLTTATSVAAQAWDAMRRAWEPPFAGARRVPGALTGMLIGWSRSAVKSLRA